MALTLIEAAKLAINSPMLEMSIDGARGILFTITGGPSLGMNEVNEAAKIVTASADEDAKIIFGAVIDPKMKDEIKITVVATGFSHKGLTERPTQVERKYTPSSFLAEKDAQDVAKQKDDFYKREERPGKVSPLKQAQAEPAKNKEDIQNIGGSEDDELGIPAFIRKKMM